ncbi:MAG: SAF domain-containing protein [Firmicutes bacterium]|nr:SAF domain-containing protein [Bacillota bacterium]
MKWKVVIGVLLIALSIVGMYYWESYGRDRVMLTPVLTVAADIPEGSLIRAEDLAEMRVPGEDVISGALTLADAGSVVGKYASLDLLVNQQLVSNYFCNRDLGIDKGESVFSIPSSWIFSRSSALRAGDRVRIYSMPEQIYLGSFRLAFVKDNTEQEVTGGSHRAVLDRQVASSAISNIEIICSLSDYFRIFDSVAASFEDEDRTEGPLLIVMEI